MLRVSLKSAVKSFADCHLQTRRAIFQVLGPSSSQCQNRWQRKREAGHSLPSLQHLHSVQRVFQHQDSSVPDMTLPEVSAQSEESGHAKKNNDRWDKQYLQLKAFYKEHGHMCVSRSCDKTLAEWIRRQREAFRIGTIPEDRVQKLLEFGFCFDTLEAVWMENYEELKAYKAHYGDTMVPIKWPSNPILANWVDTQRQNYASRMKGESHLMTDERIALLEALDFAWNAWDARWQMRFEELKEHVRMYGPGQYPSASSRDWVRHQRRYYEGYLEGKKVPLTAERVRKLSSLGIHFDAS